MKIVLEKNVRPLFLSDLAIGDVFTFTKQTPCENGFKVTTNMVFMVCEYAAYENKSAYVLCLSLATGKIYEFLGHEYCVEKTQHLQ